MKTFPKQHSLEKEDELEQAIQKVPPERRIELYNKVAPVIKDGLEFKGRVIITGANLPMEDPFRSLWENGKTE